MWSCTLTPSTAGAARSSPPADERSMQQSLRLSHACWSPSTSWRSRRQRMWVISLADQPGWFRTGPVCHRLPTGLVSVQQQPDSRGLRDGWWLGAS